jgi:hypothetical protein
MSGVLSTLLGSYPEVGDTERRELLAGARAVLDDNWAGSSTVPSSELYPHQWSWDSAFIAIGRAGYDQARAQQELETLFDAQWATGMVPHIVFNPKVPADAYFPGPSFWRSDLAPAAPKRVDTSGITQPPVHAQAALVIWRHAPDRAEARAFLTRLYPKLVAQHRHLSEQRDVAGEGLAVIVHPWESGMDNSPAWDEALGDFTIPPGALPAYQRRDLVHADPADRPSDAAYDRFVYLAMTYRDHGYHDGTLRATSPFLVEAAMFNAIRVWSAHALAEIADLVGDDPAPYLRDAGRIHEALLRRLADPATGRFGVLDVRDGDLSGRATIESTMPLLDPDLPADRVEAIHAYLHQLSGRRPAAAPPMTSDAGRMTPSTRTTRTIRTTRATAAGERRATTPVRYLVPSYDPAERDYDARRYWRGPVWANTNWLVYQGLRLHGLERSASAIAASTAALVHRSGFREYFDPAGGAGYGSNDFSWTAAVLLDLFGGPSA